MKTSTKLLVTVALLFAASILFSQTRAVDPLILPQWHSSDPWNARCPGTPGNRANAGSHALALAKTMKYWAYPTSGTGSVSYVDDDYGNINSNFSQTINWDGMSNTLVFQTTQRFIFMCGASVYTDYELQNSSSTLTNVRSSLINFFSYDPAMQIRDRDEYTNFYWKAMIRAELDASRPVIYTATLASGREVAFIVDGYDEAGLFHINWSDVNVPDAWVELNSLSYMGEDIPETAQQMITGIRPSLGPVSIDENFETDFSNFNWQFSGHAFWTISTEAAFYGTQSAKSGNINDNQTTSMFIQINVSEPDTISFFKRVSCEAEPNHLYDHLAFLIDGVEQERWSGDGVWEYHEYPVTSGVHEFRWTYEKDGASDYFGDCAWVDAIDLPEGSTPLNPPRFVEAELFAGNDVTVNWDPPAGSNPSLIGYRVYRNGSQIVQYNNPAQNFHNDYNLPNGDYTYHLRAVFAEGISGPSNSSTVTVEVPYAPTNLVAELSGVNTGHLMWQAPPLLRSRALMGFKLYRDDIVISEIESPETLEYFEPGLAQGAYYYKVSAVYATGESDFSNTALLAVGVPEPPLGLQASVNGANVNLSWQQVTQTEFLTGFKIIRNGSLIHQSDNPLLLNYQDLSLPNGTYTYHVRAVYGDTESGNSAPAVAFVEVPYPPSGLTATVNGDDITLNWLNPQSGRALTHYYIYRDGAVIAAVFNPNTLIYLDQNLPNAVYSYQITAFYSGVESAPSVPAVALVEVLYPPTGLQASVNLAEVQLNWMIPATQGGLRAFLGYKVYRNGVLVATIDGGTNSYYTDSSLPNGIYNYGVSAYYSTGESTQAVINGVSVEVLYPVAALNYQVNGDDVSLWWNAPPNAPGRLSGASRALLNYQIYRDGALLAETTGTSYDDADLANGIYQYYVSVVYDSGTSLPSPTIQLEVEVLYPPANLVHSVNGSSVSLVWDVPATSGGRGLLGYNVYRDDTLLGMVTSNGYTDSGLANGVYLYKVSALYAGGESSFSNTETAVVEVLYTPAQLQYSVQDRNDVHLSWQAPQTGPRGFLAYRLYRNGSQILQTTDLSFTDQDLADGVYVYQVTALYDSGESDPSNSVSPFIEYPWPPTGLMASVDQDDVTLSWDVLPGTMVRYQLFRDGAQIADLDSNGYVDTNLANGTYSYYLSSSNASESGISDPSAPVSASVEVLYPPTGLTYQTDDDDVILSWTASATTGGLRSLLGYDVYRDGVIIARTADLTYTDASLPNGIYQYYITAAYDSGNSGPSNTVTVNLELLYPPSLLTHTVNADDVSLSWTAAPISGGLRSFNGYNIYRDGSLIGTVFALSYDDLNLANGIYQYYVTASYTTGESTPSNTETAYVEVLYAPSELSYITEDDDVVLNWNAAPNQGRALLGYRVYKDGAFLTQTSGLTYRDANLPNGIYQYYVTALWDSGESAASNTVTVNLEVLYPAGNLTHVVNGDDVSLSWTAPLTSGGLRALLGYKVIRDGSQIALVNTSSYDDLNLANGVYHYSVIATYDSGDATPTNEITAIVEVLYAPSALTHTVNGDDVSLSWTAAPTQARAFLGYNIYRDGILINNTFDVSYTDQNLANGVYQYYVTANYDSGESIPTNTETAIVEVFYPPTGLTYQTADDDVILNWTASATTGGLRSLQGYDVYRDGVIIARTADLTYTDASLPNGVYQYYITAAYDSGNSGPSNTVTVNLELLYPPSLLTHTVNADDVSLSWTAAPSSGGLRSFNGYNIYRDGSLIGTVFALSYDDLNLANGIYQYYVTASYTTGESTPSNTETAYVEVLYAPSELSYITEDDDVVLNWNAAPNQGRALLGYRVYKDGVFLVQTSDLTYRDANLPNGIYQYYVTALWDSGESASSNTVTVNLEVLYPAGNLTHVVNGDDVSLSWTAPVTSGGLRALLGYKVIRDGSQIALVNTSSYDDLNLANGVYVYSVIASYDSGDATPTNEITAIVEVLYAPSALTHTVNGDDVSLSWTAAPTQARAFLGYNIYRDGSLINNTFDVSYTDQNLANGVYQYYVTANYDSGESNPTNTETAIVEVLYPPTGLTYQTDDDDVILSWTASAITGGLRSLLGYDVYRDGLIIARTADLTYTDASLPNGIYQYYITAAYDSGNSGPSNTVTVNLELLYPPSLLTHTVNGDDVSLGWTAAPSSGGLRSFNGYNIYRDGSLISTVNTLSYDDLNLPNGIYQYYVTASYTTGESTPSNTETAYVEVLYPPSGLSLSLDADDVSLTWAAPINAPRGLLGYKVYRNGAFLADTITSSWADLNLPNGLYSYLVSASYDAGESMPIGPVSTEIDIAYPVTALSASVSEDDVTLSWTLPAVSGGLRAFQGYFIYRNNMLHQVLADPSLSSWTDTGLANGDYSYYLIATYDAGLSIPSNTVYVNVNVMPDLPAPLSLSLSMTGVRDLRLDWQSPSPNVLSYQIYRNDILIGSTVDLIYVETNLPNGSYQYYVKALYAEGLSSASNSVMANIMIASPPSGTGDLSSSGNSVSFSWNAPGQGEIGYIVYRNGVEILYISDPLITSFTDSGLSNGNYFYQVAAVYAGVISTPVDIGNIRILIPYAPSALNLSGNGDTVNLSWTAPADLGLFTAYNIYRNGGFLVQSPVPSYTDSGLANGSYSYYVTSQYQELESGASNTESYTTSIAYAPGNLSANAVEDDVLLSWTGVSDLGGFVAYRIWRDGNLIGSSVTSTWAENNLPNGTYNYQVTTLYSFGESQASNPAQVNIELLYPATGLSYQLSGDDVQLAWTAAATSGGLRSFLGYKVYRDGSFLAQTLQTSYNDPDLANGSYLYHVVASYSSGDASPTPVLNVLVELLYAPSGLSHTVSMDTVSLTWTAVPPAATTLQGYRVYRDGNLIATTALTTYDDSGLANGSYVYDIRAAYPNGESAPTGPVTAVVEVAYAPQNLSWQVDNDDVTLSWQAPPLSNRDLQGYQIFRNDAQIAFVTGLSYLDANLPNGNYNYYLIAQYSGGLSSPGNTITVPLFVLYAPTGLSISGEGNSRTLVWNRPNQQELYFNIYRDGNFLFQQAASDSSYTNTNIPNGTYSYTVVAQYPGAQLSQPSDPALTTVMLSYPPFGLNYSFDWNENILTITWNPPSEQVFLTGYRVRVYRQGILISTHEATHPNTSTAFTGLPNAIYQVFVASRYSDGIQNLVSDESGPMNAMVNVAYPASALTGAISDRSIQLNWTPPADTGLLMAYFIQYRIGTGSWQEIEVAPTASSYLMQNLANGQYTIFIRTRYGTENSWTQSTESNVVSLSLEAPYPPSNLVAQVDANDVSLTWTGPATTYGFQHYVITRNSVQLTTTVNTTYSDLDLANGTYSYQVHAVFGGGNSTPSNTQEVTISQAYQPGSASVSVDTDDVLVSWTAPSDTQFLTGYRIYRDSQIIATLGLQLSYTDLDLANADYVYGVDALYTTANSMMTQAGTAHVEVAYPPSNLQTAVIDGSIQASWTAPSDLGFFQHYRVYLNNLLLAEQIANSITVSEPANGSYVLKVESVYLGGVSTHIISDPIDVMQAYPAENLDLSVDGINIILSWDPPADSFGLLDYQIWKDGSLLATVEETGYTDYYVSNGFHSYFLKTMYANGSSANTPTVGADIMLAYPPDNLRYNILAENVQLIWDAPSDTGGLEGYKVYRDNELISYQFGPGATDGPLLNGTYLYYVTAVYENTLESPPTNSVSATIFIASAAEEAQAVQTGESFLISWQAPSSGNVPDLYKVWFLTDGLQGDPASWTYVGSSDSLSIVDGVHGGLIEGDFLWAVVAVYGELEADPAFSNILAANLTPPIPPVTKLLGNYPNPFNPNTNIVFWLKQDARVKLEIFNSRGQKVRGLKNDLMPAGRHSIPWDGKDSAGNTLGSGVYLYRLEADGYTKYYKMIMMK